jgi:polyisoprenoid-binding protein YceI
VGLKASPGGRIESSMSRRIRLAGIDIIRVLPLAGVIVLVPFASMVHASSPLPEATCDITFSGSSSLHDWSGKAAPVHAVLQPAAETGLWNVDLAIPVQDLSTDNEARDTRMREMFHATESPEIRASLRSVDPVVAHRDSHLNVMLTIRGVSHELPATVSRWQQDDAHVAFDADVDVSLEQFGLEAPTVLGLIRVADAVLVHAHVVVATNGARGATSRAPSVPPGADVAAAPAEAAPR